MRIVNPPLILQALGAERRVAHQLGLGDTHDWLVVGRPAALRTAVTQGLLPLDTDDGAVLRGQSPYTW